MSTVQVVAMCASQAIEYSVNSHYVIRFINCILWAIQCCLSILQGFAFISSCTFLRARSHTKRCAHEPIDRSIINIFQGMSIAFICDGNRRYMKKQGLEDPFERDDGLDKIYELIQFAYTYDIREVSFFCFAIKNFKRKSSEVDGIMNIIRDKFKSPEEKNIRIKAKIMVYGRLDLVKEDIRDKLILIQNETQFNQDILVNIFFAYSAEDEIIQGIKFNNNVDLLIRTGNEKRLSDFMIRQVAQGTSVFFAKPLWPEISSTHLFLILLKHKLEDRYLL